MNPAPPRRDLFEEVAREAYEPLQRYLQRRAGPEDTAEVLNDVLLVIWRRIDEMPHDHRLPWCYGVARRCLANQRRANTRRIRLIDRVAATHAPPVDHDPQNALDQVDLELLEALTTLTAAEAEIVRLWAWEGLGPTEIAVATQTNANAVSVALARAKRKLRDLLTRQDRQPSGHEQGEATDGTERSQR